MQNGQDLPQLSQNYFIWIEHGDFSKPGIDLEVFILMSVTLFIIYLKK